MALEYTASSLIEILNGKLLKVSDKKINGVSTDSRTISPGDIFFALEGENFDGNKFVKNTLEKGASAVVVNKPPEFNFKEFDSSIILVEDCLIALQQLASHRRKYLESIFIGVTGSNGKTTTREMISHIISYSFPCSSTSKNLNNHIGLPLTLLSISQNSQYAVIEMGMNHRGEIKQLCEIAQPHSAVISNIGTAHIGNLGSTRNIAFAKAEILENISKNSFAVVPGDNIEHIGIFKDTTCARLVTFGSNKSNDYQVSNIKANKNSVEFSIRSSFEKANCKLNIAGRHNALNAAAALAVCSQYSISLKEGASRLENFECVKARMQIYKINDINVIVDCYNANPDSMFTALESLSTYPGERIAVLGDMKELGEYSELMHYRVGQQVAKLNIQQLICVGTESKSLARAAKECGMDQKSVIQLSSNSQAAELLRERLKKGSTVLFKASRSLKFEEIIRKVWCEHKDALV